MTRPVAGLRVGVVGLGAMGRGIARLFATAGAAVTVLDVDPGVTRSGRDTLVEEAAAAGAPCAVAIAADLADLVPRVDLLCEVVLEDLAVKAALLEDVRRLAGPDLVVATNTSSLSVDVLGQAYAHPERLVGLHFFNPPTRMRLVEVVAGTRTDDHVVDEAVAWVEELGQVPVRCVDSPNFIVNRICRPIYHEAALLVALGVAPESVDAVVRAVHGHRMGPLELLDRIGLHTHLASSTSAYAELGDSRYGPVPYVRRLVRAGALGVRSGRGFYRYDDDTSPRERQAAAVVPPGPGAGRGVDVVGASASRLASIARAGSDPVAVVAADVADDGSVRVAHELAATGRDVVVDSSDAVWLAHLPPGAGMVHLHHAGPGWFAERVVDDVARLGGEAAVTAVLSATAAPSVAVPALPGLVADRLSDCLVNEATVVVQEGIATVEDVNTALRYGMNHPHGPFELLDSSGPATVVARLRAMQAASGDDRYRPSSYLQRRSRA
ncbi:3-hydroxyacyl-CoA dehydrogenase NAD-binding domain-containing protein [Nocardioides halotolerans]|uniref:3-hydroxyacyl-CoA dehydrogenase NAD-binding domain-containing protein n=1 Tax=Nocardioides halotolerans TaxID=433660 RepID=UPI000407A4BB|nr:3-hydroxyacyl-CoA dehydrogenase NAD-binding domain-containing protein [Nocardioides halotolerans]